MRETSDEDHYCACMHAIRNCAAILFLTTAAAWGQQPNQVPPQEPGDAVLSVGVKEAPPFVVRDGDRWSGLCVDLWRLVEERLDVRSKLSERSLEELLAQTATGEVDVAVAAITVTAERQESLDFSHPFLLSGLAIATRTTEQGVFGAVLGRVLSFNLLKALFALLLVLSICGVLVWLVERRANPEHFGGRGLRGLGSGLWFSAVTMTTVGYGDKAPQTIAGRAIALVWMFASIIIISSYTAAIASALTVDKMAAVVRGPEDLPHARIGTVRGSAAAQWLQNRRYGFEGLPDLPRAMTDLEEGRLDAVVYDAPILQSMTTVGGPVKVLADVLRQESYAFALPPGSPLRKRLNQALLEVLESDAWVALHQRYLGTQ